MLRLSRRRALAQGLPLEEGKKTCYNCGSEDHAARDCKAPNSNFKFAVCFTCGETGHLVRACPKNQQGIYINGGACKICKGTDHLAKDCPSRDKCLRCGGDGHISSECPKFSTFQGDAQTQKRSKYADTGMKHEAGGAVRPRGGGDDLEDDFDFEIGDALGREKLPDDEEEDDDGASDSGGGRRRRRRRRARARGSRVGDERRREGVEGLLEETQERRGEGREEAE
jgi:hypothetical protein